MHLKVIYTGIDHPNHINALDKFALGIKANGDTVECHEALNKEPDAYVIFGSWKNRDQPHHNAKRAVVASGKPFIVIETPIFGRKVTHLSKVKILALGSKNGYIRCAMSRINLFASRSCHENMISLFCKRPWIVAGDCSRASMKIYFRPSNNAGFLFHIVRDLASIA